ncbi:MAG TPA: xanthine dehydrogenase family protein subunit M [Longimicrobiaceae bacterium]|nr:xanthine dehydrogenase family protein subunit M [Longimicrobiaceae bacterium]
MRTSISTLSVLHPRSLDHALELLRDEGTLVPLAGCTDVYVGLNFGTLPATRFVDLWGLDELRGIEAADGVLRVGALATHTDLVRSPEVRARLPILRDACREVGGVQIQNRGTLAGNVANGSPAGDTLPVLAVAEATVVLRSADGERRVPFNGFYTGYRATVMRPDELIVAIEIPAVEGGQWFRKVGTRAAQAISKVVMAAVRGPRPRIALGSVGPTVVRLSATEDALASGASIAEAQRVLADEITPIDDVRSTADYRRQVALNLLARWWGEPEPTATGSA